MDLKERIKTEINIVDLIEKETGQQFTRSGSTLFLPVCPFCGSGSKKNKTPAFTAEADKGYFKCFSCDAAGDQFSFVERLHGLDFKGAYFYLAKNYLGIEPQQYDDKPLSDWEKKNYAIAGNPRQQAAMYLKDVRHLPVERLPHNAFYYDKNRNAVVFIDSEQKIMNLRFIQPADNKSKSIIEKCCRDQTLHNKLYDRAYLADRDRVFLTEGVINALSFYPRYSALAIFTTSNRFTEVEKLAGYIKDKDVILAFDPDDAGQKATEYYTDFILKNIPVKSLTRLILPDNQDINDLLKQKQLWQYLQNPDNYDYIKIDIRRRPLTFNTEDPREFEKYNGFHIEKSTYKIYKKLSAETLSSTVSDCVWQYLYRILDSRGNARHLIKVQRYDYEKDRLIIKLIEADTAQIQKNEFEKLLNNIGFSFWGSTQVYNRIKTYNLHREQEAEKIERLGFHPEHGLFFWSNVAADTQGNILEPDELGIIHYNDKAFYLETASPANKKNALLDEAKKFEYRATGMQLKEFTEKFFTAYGNNALLGLSYLAASLHRDIIFAHLGRFPNLFLFGLAGTGKTSYAEILSAVQGDYTRGSSVSDTSVTAFNRLVNSRVNSMLFFKEFNPDTVSPYVIDFLKTAYEGQGRTIGVKSTGNEIISYQTLTGILVDANYLPVNNEALFSRMIILDFYNTKFSDKQKQSYEKIKEAADKGLAQVGVELLQMRSEFEQNFIPLYKKAFKLYKDKFRHLPDRVIMHSAFLIAVWVIIEKQIKTDHADRLSLYLEEIMLRQSERLESFKQTRLFWEAVALAIKQDRILNIDDHSYSRHGLYYRIIDSRDIIAFKSSDFKELNMLYARYCKDLQIKPISDKQLKEQLTSAEYYVKPGNGRSTTQDKVFGTTALYFRFDKINDSIIQIDGVTIELT